MATWKEELGREVLVTMKCKFIEAMAIACIFLQVEEMYPDQEKALTEFLKEMIFSSVHTKSISSDLNKNTISLQNRGKNKQLMVLENSTKVLSNY